MIRSGLLKDPIEIHGAKSELDGYGASNADLEKLHSVKAEVSNLGTSEKFFNGVYTNKTVKKFRIRYIPGIKTDMRIILDGDSYDIKEVVDPTRKKRELLIVCEFVNG